MDVSAIGVQRREEPRGPRMVKMGFMVGTTTCSENLCNIQRGTNKTRDGELENSGFKGKQSQVQVLVTLNMAEIHFALFLLEVQLKTGTEHFRRIIFIKATLNYEVG